MTQRRLITVFDLERSRAAFAEAWEARNEQGTSWPGERTEAGLRAALKVLDIGVDDAKAGS